MRREALKPGNDDRRAQTIRSDAGGPTFCPTTFFVTFAITSAMTLLMTFAAPSLIPSPAAAADGFPFDQELLLDTRPMPGSKFVPTLEVTANGSAVLDLWCASVKSQLVLAGDTVTILTGPKTPRACSPQAEQSDAALLASLEQVTTWRTVSDGVELRGPQTLRFLLSTH